jgi:hypothetical protein
VIYRFNWLQFNILLCKAQVVQTQTSETERPESWISGKFPWGLWLANCHSSVFLSLSFSWPLSIIISPLLHTHPSPLGGVQEAQPAVTLSQLQSTSFTNSSPLHSTLKKNTLNSWSCVWCKRHCIIAYISGESAHILSLMKRCKITIRQYLAQRKHEILKKGKDIRVTSRGGP